MVTDGNGKCLMGETDHGEMYGWILIKDKMPEELKTVVVCYRDGEGHRVEVSGWYQNVSGDIVWDRLNGQMPLAWMSIPRPPVVN